MFLKVEVGPLYRGLCPCWSDKQKVLCYGHFGRGVGKVYLAEVQ